MKSKILNTLAGFILLLAFGLAFYFCYLLFWPVKPIQFLEGNFQTCKKSYRQGEPMCYRLHYNKFMHVAGEAIVYFEDGVIYQMPSMLTNNPAGLQDYTKVPFVIPDTLPPGNYKMHMDIVYKINPFREITVRLTSNNFDVLSKK